MESRSGMYSAAQSGGLALEMSLRRSTPPRNPTGADYNRPGNQSGYQLGAKSRSPNFMVSDDDEDMDEPGNSTDDGNRKRTGWHRVKWTDNMVRLLIMAVFYIGDEVAGNEGGGNEKKKQGKWRSVSGVMMEKGFNVSPQQCEDKFNDLNKRYKRVNDILGKGTACRVVEDQSLLDGMDHLSVKAKEEVRKMINSKHLFFREMCAYHNSCNHGGGGGGGGSGGGGEARVENPPAVVNREEDCDEDDDDEDDDDNNDDNEEEEEEDGEIGGMAPRKKARMVDNDTLYRQLEGEMMNVLRDGRKGSIEKRQWLKAKMVQLEEDGLSIQSRGLELEKQRLKWLKFSAKKEMELEKERLMNERMRLEHERMAMVIRKQELDLIRQRELDKKKSDDPH